MLFDIALHPDGELIAVTILVRLQAKALPYEIAINGAACAVDKREEETGVVGCGIDVGSDWREHLSAFQDREVIGDQFRSGEVAEGTCVGPLVWGDESELTDKSRTEDALTFE